MITCVCMTHGRQWVLEEALESFLRQEDRKHAELLIVNDCPEQRLFYFGDPTVHIVNLSGPFDNLLNKSEFAIELAKGKHIAWWDDDDISLPNRLELSLAKIGDAVCYRTGRTWTLNFSKLSLGCNFYFGSSLFLKTAAEFGPAPSRREYNDIAIDSRLKAAGEVKCDDVGLDLKDMFFVYRWGGMDVYHDSGRGPKPDPEDRHRAFRKATLANPRFVPGDYVLKPHWERDYQKMVSDVIEGVNKRADGNGWII